MTSGDVNPSHRKKDNGIPGTWDVYVRDDRTSDTISAAALQLLLERAAEAESPDLCFSCTSTRYLFAHLVDRCDRREPVAPPRPLVAAAVPRTIGSSNSGIFTVAPVSPPLAPRRLHLAKEGRKAGYLTCFGLRTAVCCGLRGWRGTGRKTRSAKNSRTTRGDDDNARHKFSRSRCSR